MAGAAVGSAAGFTPQMDLGQMSGNRRVNPVEDNKQGFQDIISKIGTMATETEIGGVREIDPVQELRPVEKSSQTGSAGSEGSERSSSKVSVDRKADDTGNTGKEATATDGSKKTDTDVKNNDRVEKPETTGEEVDQEGLSDEEIEVISEALSSGMQNIITQIAETLGITEEEVTSAMESLGVSEIALFDPKTVTDLFLNLTGQDETALLTDGDLMEQLTAIQDVVSESMESLAEALEIPVEDLKEQIAMQLKPEAPVQNEASGAMQAALAGQAGLTEETAAPSEYKVTARVNGQEVQLTVSVDEAGQPVVQNVTAASQENSEFGEQHHKGGKDHSQDGAHQVLQGMTEGLAQNSETMVTEAQAGSEVQSFTDQVNQTRIMTQINDYIRANIRPDVTDMEMQLHPASLGNVTVHLTEKQGVITAQFTTENDAVKAAVESQLVQLRERFEEQGIKVSEIQVMVSQERFADRDGRGNQETEEDIKAQKAGRRRRLRVGGSGDDGEGGDDGTDQETDEADRIAVDMMQRSGNTIDYTA
ncbi:MAG: flagellar hook-length control protein FliK [Lachnospiraceae bacterium]|nr:flagellar hook-length control protein FliK [Lachnospiraceae bacterium]